MPRPGPGAALPRRAGALPRPGGGSALLALLILLAPAAGHGRTPSFSRDERARLGRGEVISRSWKLPGGRVGTGWAAGVVRASPEAVFSVIAAVERYREFMNRVTRSEVVERRADGSYDFYYAIDMPWPLNDHWCVTRNIHHVDRKKRRYRRQWTLVKGTFVHNRGYWEVRPFGRDRALLLYSVVLRPQLTAPDFVLNHVSRVALPRSVTTMRKRVRELRRRGELPKKPTVEKP